MVVNHNLQHGEKNSREPPQLVVSEPEADTAPNIVEFAQ
jgi:hypothetical protein